MRDPGLKIGLGVCCFLAAGFFVPASRARAAMSFDEFLNYSVKDLQTRMAEVAQVNASLRQKTDALRNRILFLRQEMRSLDDKKMRFLEDATQVKEGLDIQSHRQDLDAQKAAQAEEKKNNLKQEGQNFQSLLIHREERQKEIRREIEVLQKQVEESPAQSEQKKAVSPEALKTEKARGLAAQKKDLANQLAEQQKKNAGIEKEISRANRETAQSQAGREDVQKEKEFQEARIAKIRQESAELDKQIQDLMSHQKQLGGGQEEAVQKIRAEIEEMEYRKTVLLDSLKLIETRYATERAAVKDFEKDEPRLNQYRAALSIENQGLREKEQEFLLVLKQLKGEAP